MGLSIRIQRIASDLLSSTFDVIDVLRQPEGGKVGFQQFLRGDVVPQTDKEELIYILRKPQRRRTLPIQKLSAYSRARCITVYEPQFFADAAIQVAFVGMQARLTMHVPADDIGDRLCIGRGNME